MQNIVDIVNQYYKPLLLIFSIVIILLIYFLISRILTRFAKRNQNVYLDDLSTGIKLVSRFFAGYFIIVTFGLYFNLAQNIVLILTGIVATIVTLSSVKIINNFLAGIVIIVLQPFEVNDYVNINGYEGRITKITLNYTKMVTLNNAYVLLPNGTILHADLVNYTIHKKPEKKDNTYLDNAQNILIPFIGDKITRYNFQISLDFLTSTKVLPKMREVCQKYTETFGYEPKFFLFDMGWKLFYQVQISSDDSEIIRTNLKDFRNTLLKAAYD